MKKNKILRVIALFVFLSLSIVYVTDTSSAKLLDLHHTTNLDNDVSFSELFRRPSVFVRVSKNLSDYYMEGYEGKFYRADDVDRLTQDGSYFDDVINKMDYYISIDSCKDLIDSSLAENTINHEEKYDKNDIREYKKLRSEIENYKKIRYVKRKDLDNKIESLKNKTKEIEYSMISTTDLRNLIANIEKKDLSKYKKDDVRKLNEILRNAKIIAARDKYNAKKLEKIISEIKIAFSKLNEEKKVAYIASFSDVTIKVGDELKLPENVEVAFDDTSKEKFPIKWNLEGVDLTIEGKKEINGIVESIDKFVFINVYVDGKVNKKELEKNIEKIKDILSKNITKTDKRKIKNILSQAIKIKESSDIQTEVNRMNSEIEKFLKEYKGELVIKNIKPNIDLSVKENSNVKISFDSLPGGEARFALKIPVSQMSFRNVPKPNMVENPKDSGHYEGTWTVPDNFYGANLYFSVYLSLNDGSTASKTSECKISITDDVDVNYYIDDNLIKNEVLLSGQKPSDVPSPEKEGYIFDHWELNGQTVKPEEIIIQDSTDFKAIFNPKGNLSYTIKYLNRDMVEIAKEKVVENQSYGSEVSILPIEIKGYTPIQGDVKYTVSNSENIVNIIYDKRTDIPYNVNYKHNQETIMKSNLKYGIFKSDNIVEIPEIPGYVSQNKQEIINLNDVENNSIDIQYIPRNDIPYTIEYIKINNDGSESILDSVSGIGKFKSEITISLKDYIGLVPINSQKTIKLESPTNNKVSIKYREKDELTYTIVYTNNNKETWSEKIPSKYKDVIHTNQIKDKLISYDNQDYRIESFDLDKIVIDDRSEKNILRAKVYKVYSIDNNIELKVMKDNADRINRPSYSESDDEWSLYWNDFINTKNDFYNNEINEYNIDEKKRIFLDKMEIINSIKDFDSSWKDRKIPKSFENVINDQAKTPDVFGRLKVYVDQRNSLIKIGISEVQGEKTFIAGAVGVGVKSAMLNVLKSNNIYEVESKGVIAKIQGNDGIKKSDDELINEGSKLALKWLPPNMKIYENKWKELIGTEKVKFIIRGKTSNGSKFNRTYYFEFVNQSDI